MSRISRITTWPTIDSLQAPALNNEFNNIINAWNNTDSGVMSWTSLSVSGASTFATAITITPTSNQIVLGTTRTVTISAGTPASLSRTWTIPDIANNGTFAALEGTQTFSGTKTFSSAVAITATSNHIVLSTSSNTLTISAATQATSARTWTIPDVSGSGTFAALEGTQTFSGSKTFSSAVAVTATSNHLVLSTSSNTLTISAATQATSARTWTVPDVSGNGTFAALESAQTFTGSKTFSSTSGNPIHGTSTNDAASAGFVGEYLTANATATNFPSTGVMGDLTSLSLTAGDWIVTGSIGATLNGATMTEWDAGVSTTSGNSSTGLTTGVNRFGAIVPTAVTDSNIVVAAYRISLASTTTVFLKYEATFSLGTPQAYGSLRATRVR